MCTIKTGATHNFGTSADSGLNMRAEMGTPVGLGSKPPFEIDVPGKANFDRPGEGA